MTANTIAALQLQRQTIADAETRRANKEKEANDRMQAQGRMMQGEAALKQADIANRKLKSETILKAGEFVKKGIETGLEQYDNSTNKIKGALKGTIR